MVDFMRIGKDSYVLYKNGVRITPYPLTKSELHEALFGLTLTDEEERFIEKFYGEKGGKADQ